jgi:carbamoyltransferase
MTKTVFSETLDSIGNIVLSIHYGHNSTVGLSVNGEIKCLLSEERICRKKNACGWPINVINYICETYLNGDISKIDMLVFMEKGKSIFLDIAFDETAHKKFDYWYLRKEKGYTYLKYRFLKGRLREFAKRIFIFLKTFNKAVEKRVCSELGLDISKLYFLDHHQCHNMAALFFLDINKKYLMFSLDGAGDGISASVAIWDGEYQLLSSTPQNASLGMVYRVITGLLGMKSFGHEFKVMGMAPYAHYESVIRVKRYFDNLIAFGSDGNFHLVFRGGGGGGGFGGRLTGFKKKKKKKLGGYVF